MLKTLKEVEEDYNHWTEHDSKLLRQEAINNIKIYSKRLDVIKRFEDYKKERSEKSIIYQEESEARERMLLIEMNRIREDISNVMFLIDWIKNFFNITEDDLK